MQLALEQIRERLNDTQLRQLQGRYSYKGEAAVLMPLVERHSGLHLLLTQRSHSVATHKGQVSFPGGYREGGEPLQETALRETEEEVGIARGNVQLIGPFHDYISVTEALVRPFVGRLTGDWTLTVNSDEVAEAFEVPLDFFFESDPHVESRQHFGSSVSIYYWDWQGTSVWGLTAAMIKDFLDLFRGESVLQR